MASGVAKVVVAIVCGDLSVGVLIVGLPIVGVVTPFAAIAAFAVEKKLSEGLRFFDILTRRTLTVYKSFDIWFTLC